MPLLQPTAQLFAQVLHIAGGAVEKSRESFAIMRDRGAELGRGRSLVAPTRVVAGHDPVIVARSHPFGELFDPPYGYWVGETQLHPESGVPREDVVFVVVFGGLLHEGIEAHSGHGPARESHQDAAGCPRITHH